MTLLLWTPLPAVIVVNVWTPLLSVGHVNIYCLLVDRGTGCLSPPSYFCFLLIPVCLQLALGM